MSALHASRAPVGLAWCLAVTTAALVLEHPLALGALLAAVIGAAAASGVIRPVRMALAYGAALAVLIATVNAVVVREGLTVIVRGGEVPWLGQLDVTLEAVAMGGVLGLRALVVVAVWALHSAVVDADELLRAFRRVSLRSGLTAALAARLMPVLIRDGRRMAEAQRCRPGLPASRLGLVRAVAAGALDRAVDVAATLEVRGYGGQGRPVRRRRPWSRHDLGFAASAAAVLGVAVLAGPAFEAYPRLAVPLDGTVVAVAALLATVLLLPFADRRGVAAGAPHPHAWRTPA